MLTTTLLAISMALIVSNVSGDGIILVLIGFHMAAGTIGGALGAIFKKRVGLLPGMALGVLGLWVLAISYSITMSYLFVSTFQ